MGKKTIYLWSIIIAQLCFAKPAITLGLGISKYYNDLTITYPYGGAFNHDIILESYRSLYLEFGVDFIKYAGIRIKPFELKEYKRGGYGINLLHNVSFDLLIRPLPNGRFVPLLFGGYRFYRDFDKPVTELAAIGPQFEVRIGMGLEFRVKKPNYIFLEMEIYNYYGSRYERVPLEDMVMCHRYLFLGLNRINLGARFRL